MNRELANQRFILSTRPTLWLPLYRKAGDTFLSSDGYGHLATVTGATWGIQGRTFDGNDYISLGNVLNFTGSFTLKAWFKNNETTPTADNQMIMAKGASTVYQYRFGINTSGYAQLIVFQSDGSAHINATASTDLTDNLWHHIVGVFTYDTRIDLYVDGILVASSTTVTGSMGTGTSAFRVGNGENAIGVSHQWWFTGTIGECGADSRALTLAEVQNNRLVTKWRYR